MGAEADGLDVAPPDLNSARAARPGWLAIVIGLILVWFVMMASSAFWLPAAHKGDLGDRTGLAGFLFTPYALVAVLAAIGVRARADSARAAVLSTLPALALLGVAAVMGHLLNRQGENVRGEPLFYYFGITLWASWAVLVLATSLVAHAKWNVPTRLLATLMVALVGSFQVVARID